MGLLKYWGPKTAFIFLTISMLSCQNSVIKEVSETYENGKPKIEKFYTEKDGDRELIREIQYYENGQKRIEGEIKNGQRTGKWTFWFEHGPVWSEGFYKNGIRDGETRVFHENGNLFYQGSYQDGQKHGTWKFYDENGNLVNQVVFDKGVLIQQDSDQNKNKTNEIDE